MKSTLTLFVANHLVDVSSGLKLSVHKASLTVGGAEGSIQSAVKMLTMYLMGLL